MIHLYIGAREEKRNGFSGFGTNRDNSCEDRSLWIWASPPQILIAHMQTLGYHVSGNWLYFPGDYQGWHTNSDYPGQRLYFSWASESNKSGMKFFVNGELIDSPDLEGWNLRVFTPPIWHSVYSECVRASVGFVGTQRRTICPDSLQPVSAQNVEDLFPVT